jgi:hypothetical protein
MSFKGTGYEDVGWVYLLDIFTSVYVPVANSSNKGKAASNAQNIFLA